MDLRGKVSQADGRAGTKAPRQEPPVGEVRMWVWLKQNKEEEK